MNLEQIIISQKLELERFFQANYFVKRENNFLDKYWDSKLAKVILWPRRAWKSTYILLFLKDKKFSYLNFDDERLDLTNFDTDELLAILLKNNPEYIFFDEIQNLPNWHVFVNRLLRNWLNIILTWSNSNLLSQEFWTYLTWRYLQTTIYPFSFKEFLLVKNFDFKIENLQDGIYKARFLSLLDEFLQNGWFPDIVVNNIEPKLYLETLVDNVLTKDLFFRYNIKYIHLLKRLLQLAYSNFTKEFSYQNIRKALWVSSIQTIQKYLFYLQQVYLIDIIDKFSFSEYKKQKYNKKVFVIDNWLVNFVWNNNFWENKWKLFENFVYTELKKSWYDIYFYQDSNLKIECDFVIWGQKSIQKRSEKNVKLENHNIVAIQVCYELNEYNKKRELAGLYHTMKKLNCDGFVLTLNQDWEEKYLDKKLRIISFLTLFANNFKWIH